MKTYGTFARLIDELPLRPMKAKSILLVLALGFLCSGCGTVMGHLLGGNGIYQGVRVDCSMLARGGDPGFALDLPFSAAGDTLLLPVDLATMNPPDPLRKGWTVEPDGNAHISREIVDDYEDFIRKLKLQKPPSIYFYKDKSGRHAVKIVQEKEGERINHTLIYDRSNVRTKVVKRTEVIFHM